jgi:DNA processing protein
MRQARPLAQRERANWLRLARTGGIGPISFSRLLGRHGGIDAALEAVARDPRVTLADEASIQRELEALDRRGARLVCACEPDYPPGLAALPAPPPVLSAIGKLTLGAQPILAIVGAREASAAGLSLAAELARDLGKAGYVIASGMARGIDAAAHDAALKSGTIAVLAGGLDKPYPPQNLALFEQLCAAGLVLSEAPLGVQVRARDFPRRNHVVSGLAAGVIVVEAAWRSGSLITARAAADQGREVMAVPGHPRDPRSRGCNGLLKEGASLIENAEDVIALLAAAPRRVRPQAALPFNTEIDAGDGLSGKIANLLSLTPIHINEIARLAGAPISQVAAAITELELSGRAVSHPGGYAASPSS